MATAGFSIICFAALLASDPTFGKLAFGFISALACVAASGLASKPLFDQLYERLLFKEKFTHDTYPPRCGPRKPSRRHHRRQRRSQIYGGGAYDGAFNVSLLDDRNRIERALAVAVLHPHPKDMLMIVLSSGSWAQELVNLPGLEHLTIVVIDPGHFELSSKISAVREPHAKSGCDWTSSSTLFCFVVDSFRHPDRKFDVIVMNNDVVHWRAHVTNLLSV